MARVLVGEAPVLEEHALARWIAHDPSFTLAGSAAAAPPLLEIARQVQWDLALVDFNSLREVTASTVAELKAACGGGRVLVLCSDVSRPTLRAILRAGADSYAVCVPTLHELAGIVRRMLAGEAYFAAEIAEAFRDPDPEGDPYTVLDPGDWHLETPVPADADGAAITRRERDIIGMVAIGCGNKVIAERLGISLPTVRKHRENLMRKLGLHNAAEVAAYAIGRGLAARE